MNLGAGVHDRVNAVVPVAESIHLDDRAYWQQVWIGGKGATLDESTEFALQLGPAGAAFRDAPQDQQTRIANAVRDALAPYSTGAGVAMDARAWMVTARRG